MQESQNRYVLTIEDQKNISLTGVIAVSAFSAQQIVLDLGSLKIVICGNNLKITDFSKETGKFTAVGEILSLKYSARSAKLKLFK